MKMENIQLYLFFMIIIYNFFLLKSTGYLFVFFFFTVITIPTIFDEIQIYNLFINNNWFFSLVKIYFKFLSTDFKTIYG